MFPGRFRRRKSDSLGPRPASVSSLRARVHTHVDAQHEAGHLTQAASAEQINRRTDTARVSERPRPGGNAGQYMQAENSSQDVPLQGVVLFCQPISLAKQNNPLGVIRSGLDRPVRICEDRLQVQESRSPRVSPSRSPRRRRRRRAWRPSSSLQSEAEGRGDATKRGSFSRGGEQRTRRVLQGRERRPLEILFGGRQGESPSPPAFAPSRPPALLSA